MVPYYTQIVSKFISDGHEKCEIKVYTSLNMIVHPMIVAPKARELMSWSVVRRACICALTFSLYIFFSETTKPILMKYHRNVPAMVLSRIFERISFLNKKAMMALMALYHSTG